jgi:hypothetical protein
MMYRLTAAAGLASLALLAGCENDGAKKAEAPASPEAAAPAAEAAAPAATLTPAQEQEARALTVQLLDQAGQELARENFAAAAGQADHHVPIAQGGQADWTVNLRAGRTYRIVGVCNIGCENVDMELRDASGAVVASDVLEDDVPIVEIRPTADAAYTARLLMKACESGPCLASARVFERSGK